MMLALRLARRELRGGIRGLRTVLLCLALGVAAMAAVGSLRSATDAGMAANGRTILGGDLEIGTGAEPPPPALLQWLSQRGARVSEVTQMRSLLVAPSGERQLVELRAVDDAWPLVGTPELKPEGAIRAALNEQDGRWGLVADPVVLERLGLHPGDTARLGTGIFQVRAALISAPDRVATPAILGAPVLVSEKALSTTGLVVPGSIVSHAVRVTADDPSALAEGLRTQFADRGWRIRTPRDAAPGVGRFIDQTALFLNLVALTSLLVGGIGVANGIRAWLDARAQSIAILRCLGAPSGLVLAIFLAQVMALAAVGILVGVAVGAALPLVAMGWLRSALPVPPVGGIYARPLLVAAGLGLLTALCFGLWPLGRAARLPPGALFRDAVLPGDIRPSKGVVAATLVLVVGLVGLTLATSEPLFAGWFCAAVLATLALLRLGGVALARIARVLPRPEAPGARLGLGNLYRPGSQAPVLLLSVGLGLSTLACVALIQGNLRRQISQEMPVNAPSFFFVDIQPDQVRRFDEIVRSTPGVRGVEQMPSLRARIVAVNGVPAEQVKATAETRWGLRGDRGLTYAAAPPPGTRLVAGSWWPGAYKGKPLVSVDANLARGWGLEVGGTIRVNVLGRDLDLTVANLRDVAWQRMGLNFVLVASPGLLEAAPHTQIATVRIDGPQRGALLRQVTDALPNVTGIEVQSILNAIAGLLDQLAAALAVAGLLTLVIGGLVLVAALAAGQRRRTQEAVILKILGATKNQLRMAWLTEFGILGLAAGAIAAVVGTAASWAIMRFVMHTGWSFLPGALAGTLFGALATMLVLGYIGTLMALEAKAAPLLRNE